MSLIQHQRFHITCGKKRTTVSLDDWLAGLLAVRLGEKPGDPKAIRRVQTWLQERTVEDPGGPGLNRRLIRHTTLEVVDKELSSRCAAWLKGPIAAPVKATSPQKQPPTQKKRDLASTPPPTPNRFILYRAEQGFPPDIVARGSSREEIVTRVHEMYADYDAQPAMLRAKLITTEKERHGAYYIRRCSEDFWNAFKTNRDIRPVTDATGLWRTRAERTQIRKSTAWLDTLRKIAQAPRRTG